MLPLSKALGVEVNSRIENIVAIIIGLAFLPPLYIKATMNALRNNYYPGILEFKTPFYYAYSALILVMLFFLLASIYQRLRNKKTFPLAYKSSLSVIAACALVWLLGYAPCFYEHTHPHTLQTLVSQSLLCPSYSIRSHTGLIITMLLCVLTFLVSGGKKVLTPNKALKFATKNVAGLGIKRRAS